jgi:hypothetical protein
MDACPVLVTNWWSNTTIPCLSALRMVRVLTWIVPTSDPIFFGICNDTGYNGHPASTPATGSFQA